MRKTITLGKEEENEKKCLQLPPCLHDGFFMALIGSPHKLRIVDPEEGGGEREEGRKEKREAGEEEGERECRRTRKNREEVGMTKG